MKRRQAVDATEDAELLERILSEPKPLRTYTEIMLAADRRDEKPPKGWMADSPHRVFAWRVVHTELRSEWEKTRRTV